VTGTAASLRMPYPGLRSFRREESDLFFGREDSINTMVDRLAATRFLAVLGSSGTGKSSVVKTGLLEALDLGIMTHAGSSWRVVDFRPGSAPLANLARRLLETESSQLSAGVSDAEVELLRAFLVRGPRSIVEWCGDGHLQEHTNMLLLVDQFEELFRYQDYAGREVAEAFSALLLESARSERFPVYVALTMRSEYLGACALIDGLAEAISTGMFLIPRMTRGQCRSAIVGPAAVCDIKIEDALINRLLNDLAAFAPWDDGTSRDQLDRLVRRADQLPLLQYCLNRMFVRAQSEAHDGPVTLTLAEYERIAGLSGALNAHADEVLNSLGADNRATAESVFRALTEGTTVADATRRPTRLKELAEIADDNEAAVRTVVDAFRAPGCNILVPELDLQNPKPLDASAVVDISHESLIRQWKRLSEWLDKEARSVRQWRRLKDLFEDGRLMGSTELANVRPWLHAEKPNAAWMKRQGGDFSAIVKFVHKSERWHRRFAPLMMPVTFVAMLLVGLVVGSGMMYWIDPSRISNTATWPWQLDRGMFASVVGLTCAIGLWHYGGLAFRRALLAAILLIGLNGLGGWLLGYHQVKYAGVATGRANFTQWLLLLAPCTITGLAIFDRAFRRPLPWVLLVAYAVIGFRGQSLLLTSAENDNLLMLLVWLTWFAAIGYQFKNGVAAVPAEHWRRLAFLQLPLLMLASLLTVVLWVTEVFFLRYGATAPVWPWFINIAIASLALALACGVGLSRFAGFDSRRAVTAAISIFALECASGAVLVAALLSRGVPLPQTYDWWSTTIYAPCALLVLALFEPVFRRISVWLPLATLFAGVSGLLMALRIYGAISDPTQTLLFLTMFTVWLAAIGYVLQWVRPEHIPLAEVSDSTVRLRPPGELNLIRDAALTTFSSGPTK
jgi:hypothetical protein